MRQPAQYASGNISPIGIGDSSDGHRSKGSQKGIKEQKGIRKLSQRKNYNPWGRTVDMLLAKRGLTVEGVGDMMRRRGFRRQHPRHALNRAMQRDHWKAITPYLHWCVVDVLNLSEEERDTLREAHEETGEWAHRQALVSGDIDASHKGAL